MDLEKTLSVYQLLIDLNKTWHLIVCLENNGHISDDLKVMLKEERNSDVINKDFYDKRDKELAIIFKNIEEQAIIQKIKKQKIEDLMSLYYFFYENHLDNLFLCLKVTDNMNDAFLTYKELLTYKKAGNYEVTEEEKLEIKQALLNLKEKLLAEI